MSGRPYVAPSIRRLELAEVLERNLDVAFGRPIRFRGERLLPPTLAKRDPEQQEVEPDRGDDDDAT
jgi:hypothetical protein